MSHDEQERDGQGRALPLILLPGTLCDERVFGPLRERLPGVETRVVLTPAACSVAEAAREVLAVAPDRFAVLGFSLGGMVAMELALSAPQRVRGLALVSTTPLPVPLERHGSRRIAVEEARSLGLHQFVREHLWPAYGAAAKNDALLPLLVAMAESLGHETFSRQTEMALSRTDFRERLAEVRCPTLVLAGNEDRLCPPEAQQELAKALRDCTCVMLPGVGHLALLERADEVAAAVAAWLNTVQQEVGVGNGAGGRTGLEENG